MSKTPSEHGTLFCEYECNQWVSKALELNRIRLQMINSRNEIIQKDNKNEKKRHRAG